MPPEVFFTAINTASDDVELNASVSIHAVPVAVDESTCPEVPDTLDVSNIAPSM